jgi:hypothetical protein
MTADRIRIIKHEAVPRTGSIEVRFPDGRPSRCFYWVDIPSRRLRPEQIAHTIGVKSQTFGKHSQDAPGVAWDNPLDGNQRKPAMARSHKATIVNSMIGVALTSLVSFTPAKAADSDAYRDGKLYAILTFVQANCPAIALSKSGETEFKRISKTVFDGGEVTLGAANIGENLRKMVQLSHEDGTAKVCIGIVEKLNAGEYLKPKADDTRWTTDERYVQSDAVAACSLRMLARPEFRNDPAKQDEVDAIAESIHQRCMAAAKALTKQQAAEVLIEREKASECYRLAGVTPKGPDCAKVRKEEKVLKTILGLD